MPIYLCLYLTQQSNNFRLHNSYALFHVSRVPNITFDAVLWKYNWVKYNNGKRCPIVNYRFLPKESWKHRRTMSQDRKDSKGVSITVGKSRDRSTPLKRWRHWVELTDLDSVGLLDGIVVSVNWLIGRWTSGNYQGYILYYLIWRCFLHWFFWIRLFSIRSALEHVYTVSYNLSSQFYFAISVNSFSTDCTRAKWIFKILLNFHAKVTWSIFLYIK